MSSTCGTSATGGHLSAVLRIQDTILMGMMTELLNREITAIYFFEILNC